jgi:glycosyltransferase involved in cell wall biosynthesis
MLTWRERRAGWRELVPELMDFERAFGPVIEEVEPDIIHAHDFPMIGLAVRHALVSRAAGRDVRVIYDAHEFTAGVALPDPRRERGYLDLESEYIKHADAVTTVSVPIAERIAAHHDLDRVPDVVMNVPLARTIGRSDGPTVRDVVGLADDVPLVVYSGNTSTRRRVELLVEAMQWVPNAHLVVVCNDSKRRLAALHDIADRVGVSERLHIAPYAPPDQVSHYLSTATVGVHPLSTDHLNHQLALPNKLFEYLHAALPMVVSDNSTMAGFVRQHGLGVVFEGDSAEELAARVNEVLEDPSQFALGAELDELRARHTWEGQEPTLCGVYGRVVGEPVSIIEDIAFTMDEVPTSAGRLLFVRDRTGRDLSRSSPRLVIGPANMAGQAWEWARALEDVSEHAAVEVLALRRGYDFPADQSIEPDQWNSLEWQLETARHVLTTHTHALLEAGLPLLGRLNGATFDCDVPSLRTHGIAVAVVQHGSELRNPRRHRELEDFSPFGLGTDPWVNRIQQRVDDLLPRLQRFDGTKFVSTVGLLDFLPEAQWLPVVVDTRTWRPRTELLAHEGPPVVLYTPTNRRLKGAESVLRACRDLESEGIITFRPMQGVPYEDMPEKVQEADILIDGLLLGDYGVTACQAMASGRVVVGNVSRRVRQRIAGSLPIVQADPESLRRVLAELAQDRDRLRDVGHEGQEFVARFHDGAYSGKALAEWAENTS